MPWRPIARRELSDLLAGRTTKAGLAVVALVFVGGGYAAGTPGSNATVATYANLLGGVVPFVVGALGLLLGYRSVVGDRAAGRLALVLALPHSRADVLAGKLLARGGVAVGTLAVGILVGGWLVEYPFGSVDLLTLAAYLAATLALGLALFGVGTALSTLTVSPRRATVGAFVVLVAVTFWGQLRVPLLLALDYFGLTTPSGGLPEWALFLHGLEPTAVYGRVVDAFVVGVERGPYLGPDAAWYLGGTVAAVLLVAWATLPLAAGYLRFRGTDL
ncbi:ABC transporter permease [Halosegnis marinus]|uniref:ABC transporter permease n=1 Tax=Halosegnis marinus TaxID=3034023 RepID=A0ABD5ZN62_9EURY|nr:ABC transporter permease subunit [Halosegnis sp. DT85]